MDGERMKAVETVQATVARGGGGIEMMDLKGVYVAECRGPDGSLKWVDVIQNLVTTLGKNLVLDSALAGAGYNAAFYMGLVDGAAVPVYAAADTPAAHPGWIENTKYTQAPLPPLVWLAAGNGVKTTSAGCVFSINTNAQVIAGCFVGTSSAKPAVTGTLLSCGSFAGGNKLTDAGDTLTVSYQMSL